MFGGNKKKKAAKQVRAFGAGRTTSAKAAEQYARQQADKAGARRANAARRKSGR